MIEKNSVNSVLDGFFEPDPGYRPAAMWYWNDELREDCITEQLEEFKKQGVNDFFVNHTWGAMDDYLGARYFEAIRHAVAESKRLGLSFWIYDEFNWPSGVAGGKLLRDRPETRAKLLRNTRRFLAADERVERLYIDGHFFGAYRVFADDPAAGSEDISDKATLSLAPDGFYLDFHNDCSGEIVLHILSVDYQRAVLAAGKWGKYSFEQPGYVDALDKNAIRAFIDYTHERYRREIGGEFGKTVRGVFTDEVCVASPFDVGEGRVPWNDRIPEGFRERFGYELRDYAPALLQRPANLREKRARYHFWRLLTELVRDSHIKQVYEWCDSEGLLYTGHFDGEESLVWSMYQSGDIFELMKWMHVPGIDSIFSRERINDENFNVAGKLVSSCAKYYGRDRILCETYTGSSSKLRFDEMRRIANRLVTLGVNMLQYMGAFYSLDGARKDFPLGYMPSHNSNNTMFERYGGFGDYAARIQYVCAKTKPSGRVLVMWPQTGVYVNIDGHMELFSAFYKLGENEIDRYDVTMIGLVNALLELNIEYDIFGDSMADRAAASDGHAELYGAEYDAVILPLTGDTTRAVLEMAKRLQRAGVRLIFIDELPENVVDEAVCEPAFGTAPEGQGLHSLDGDTYFLRVPDGSKRRGKNGLFKQLLLEALGEERVTLGIRHDGGIITGLRGRGGDRFVFITNDLDRRSSATIEYISGMTLLDAETGKRVELTPENGRAGIFFEPYQMYLLVQPEDGREIPAEKLRRPVGRHRSLGLGARCGIKLDGGNVLRADWSWAHCADDAPEKLPDETGLEALADMRLPGRYAYRGSTGVLAFDFDAEFVPERLTLFIESRDVRRCELNGVQLEGRLESCRLWGPNDRRAEVGDIVMPGRNRLTALIELPDCNMPYLAPFAMLRGDFVVCGTRLLSPERKDTPSPLNRQGRPQFCGGATYSFELEIAPADAGKRAELELETRDAAEVAVNGKTAGVKLWAPFRFDVSGLLRPGTNRFEVNVTVPMENLFGGDMDVGLLSQPRLVIYDE